jgi:hypothetical protein
MSAIRCIETAGCIAAERLVTSSRVMLPRRGSRQGGKTIGRVVDSGCKAEEGISSLSRVGARIAAVRSRDNRSHCGRKPNADEYERDEKKSEPQRRPVD